MTSYCAIMTLYVKENLHLGSANLDFTIFSKMRENNQTYLKNKNKGYNTCEDFGKNYSIKSKITIPPKIMLKLKTACQNMVIMETSSYVSE